MPVPTIYYLRHGETEWNALGRLQGTRDVPLNARGRGQAEAVGSRRVAWAVGLQRAIIVLVAVGSCRSCHTSTESLREA